jgi:hypothetical protein
VEGFALLCTEWNGIEWRWMSSVDRSEVEVEILVVQWRVRVYGVCRRM